ncbi:hypothetical protein ACO0LO_02810 [Undibacterium sp. TJN25]|uniref:hypothetical protein n=1 Tax=Undibacterium sp. TJN25 TaxID=3413056 RepID=UPI003BF31140
MSGINLISFVSALTALIASVAGPLVTIYATRSQINATVRSGNRQRWIDEFRDAIAHFCSEVAIVGQGREKIIHDGRIVIKTESEFLQVYGKLIYSANKIRLMTNPTEPQHQQLLEIIDGMFVLLRTAAPDRDLQHEGQEIVCQIVSMSVSIIRQEWNRVQLGV